MERSAPGKTIKDKIVIITGGTQGVGKGIARHMAQLGLAGLVICGRNQKQGRQVARMLTELGPDEQAGGSTDAQTG